MGHLIERGKAGEKGRGERRKEGKMGRERKWSP